MKTELLGQEKNVVRVRAEFEEAEFKKSLEEAIGEISRKASIPGFRKGHIPRKVLEMRFGRDELQNEALEKLVPGAIEQIITDYELDTIAAPALKVENIKEGEPVVCELTFEVSPEVSLPELEEIEVEKLVPKVTEDMVEEMVREFRTNHSTLASVERPAEAGDVVLASFTTIVDGNETADTAPQSNEIDLAAPSIRPEVKEALLGKSKGDEAEAEFEVDEDYQDKSVAGKKVRYHMTVEDVKERILPEMNPEFYQKVLGVDLDTEEAFREELRKRIGDHMERESSNQAANRAIELLKERAEVEVPDTLLNRQMQFLRDRDTSEAKRRFDMDMEAVLRQSSIGLAEYEQSVREKAVDIVRRTLVLDEVGKKYEVDVQKEEVEAEINRMAENYNMDPARLRAVFYKDRDRMIQIVDDIRYGKIAKLIMEKVSVKEVDELSPAVDASEGVES